MESSSLSNSNFTRRRWYFYTVGSELLDVNLKREIKSWIIMDMIKIIKVCI